MKNSKLVIKIAFIVSAAATVFSVVTLIRAIIIRAHIVLPIIQVVGSAAIFGICFLMFRALSAASDDEEGADGDEKDIKDDTEPSDLAEEVNEEDEESAVDEEIDELKEKYHLPEFEEKSTDE